MIENNDIFSTLLASEMESLLCDQNAIDTALFATLRFSPTPRGGDKNSFLCDTSCRKNYDHFWNTLNGHFFGRKYKASKKRTDKYQLRHLSVLHQHKDAKRSHVHCIIIPPIDVDKEYLRHAIRRFWSKTYFGTCHYEDGWQIDFRDVYSSGVIAYPIKEQMDYESYVLGAYIGSGRVSDLIHF